MTSTETIPTSAAELEQMLHDGPKMRRLVDTPAAFGEFITAYARASMETDQGIAEQVRDETRRVLADYARDNPGMLARPRLSPIDGGRQPNTSAAKCAAYTAGAPGAGLDDLFSNAAAGARGSDGSSMLTAAGRFLRNTWHANRSPEAQRLQGEVERVRNDYSSTIPADGGFLIPEVLRSQLLQVALESAIVRPRAMVVPMDSLSVPFPMIDVTTHVGSVYGGMVGYWTEEAGDLATSSAKFGRITLTAKKLAVYSEVPNELFQDAIISMQAFIDQKAPQALAWFEDLAFMRGTGVGEPLGFLHAGNTAAVSVAKENLQPAGTIVWENIVKMYSRMLPSSLASAVWVVHPDTFPELATMALSVGTGGSAIWLNNGTSGPPMTILGRPVEISEKCSTVGTAGDINFVDLGYYLVGDRMAMQASNSPHYKFANDITAFRIIERVDGRPWIKSAITPAQGTNTLSPFVRLATRA
jgi:HK97 family phage major capsid protein